MDFPSDYLDLKKEIHPLTEYLDDRNRLLEEMFSSLQEDCLQSLIPPSLKGLSLQELKDNCLQQLILLPRESILDIFSGPQDKAVGNDEAAEVSTEEELIIHNSDEDLDVLSAESQTEDASTNQEISVPVQELENRSGGDVWLNTFTQTQMEILELEMRARAIRSLMKAQGVGVSDDASS